jgi:hypothetical protein
MEKLAKNHLKYRRRALVGVIAKIHDRKFPEHKVKEQAQDQKIHDIDKGKPEDIIRLKQIPLL